MEKPYRKQTLSKWTEEPACVHHSEIGCMMILPRISIHEVLQNQLRAVTELICSKITDEALAK